MRTRIAVAVAVAVAALARGSVAAAPSSSAAAPATAPRTVVVSPGQSVQAAIDSLPPAGGVIALRGGTYHQRVHLYRRAHVTVRPYRGQHVVISGAGLTPPKGISALVAVADSTDVTVSGLEFTGYRTRSMGAVPAGVYVHGHDSGVRILGNHVHHLGNDNTTLGSFDINAHGIAVYGDDPAAPITGLTIAGNTVDHLHLGASETVVVNGNVAHWSIVRNRIHDDNNIGIDAIGFESTLPGRYRYTRLNRARDGLIAHNTVTRIRSKGNPSYWDDGWCNCADGIYVDGGTHIAIRDNHVTGSDIGIEVAAENGRGTADHVTVTRNRISGSLFTGITTGGYCNGARSCGGVRTGSSHDNVFSYNVLRGNNILDDGSPELLVQYHAHRNSFVHNTITATNGGHVVYGTVPGSDSSGNTSDHNRFVGTPSTLHFGWRTHVYAGFAAYRDATGQDRHSTAGK